MAYVPKKHTTHQEGYMDKKLAAREISGRAVVLKALKEIMTPILRQNRREKMKQEYLAQTLPDYFSSYEKLDEAYANGSMGIDTYYYFRRVLRQKNGDEERLITKEEVAERILMEFYDKVYKEMEQMEVANMTDAERRSYIAKQSARKRKERAEREKEDEELRKEIENENPDITH